MQKVRFAFAPIAIFLFRFFLCSFILVAIATAATGPAANSNPIFANISSLQKSLGFEGYYRSPQRGRPLKVAVFDKGFDGYKAELGRSIPANTVYVPGPVLPPPEVKIDHGLHMAQILTALATDNLRDPGVLKEFYLYNVFGYSNFKAAVDDAIRRHIDVISYSEVWEYGGNSDGGGFINAQVSRATAAGIIWVNAAGNFALTTYNGPIVTGKDDWVRLPDQNQGLSIRCEADKGHTCPVKIVLSWNSFSDDVEAGTNKDLDLALTDDLLNIVQTSALKQVADAKEEQPGISKYPREIITAKLKPGIYFLRVKNRSQNFTSEDRLRITVDGEQIKMPSRSHNESLLNPADNPSVITVGAVDSDRSSFSVSLHKPEISTASSLVLRTGGEPRGSSNAAAMVAAAVVRARIQNPQLQTKEQILQAISYPFNWKKGGLSEQELLFGPRDGNCFRALEWPEAPEYVKRVFYAGGVLVDTTQGYRLMVPYDPIRFTPGQHRVAANDMILLLPDGSYDVRRRGSPAEPGSSEVFQRPIEAGLCAEDGLIRTRQQR